MTATMDPKKSVKKLYDDGMAEVFKIVGSLDSTPSQVRAAKKTAKGLSSMLIAHTLESIESRTALLSGFIVELNEVIETIETNPPYAGAMSKMTSVINRAKKLFGDEKKKLP